MKYLQKKQYHIRDLLEYYVYFISLFGFFKYCNKIYSPSICNFIIILFIIEVRKVRKDGELSESTNITLTVV